MIAGRPQRTEALPPVLVPLVAGSTHEAVWRNENGGVTFQLHRPGLLSRFIKWNPTSSGINLEDEIRRLRWVSGRVRVPTVVASGSDETGSWMMTEALPGRNAVDPYWTARPGAAATAIGAGLRALHDAFAVGACPFSWRLSDRLQRAEARRGDLDPRRWHVEHAAMSVSEAFHIVRGVCEDDLVVCHGDACAPNTLIGDDGRFSGHVDLGSLGVADRWADLAVATWSLSWNYGPGWEADMLAAYGIERDPQREAAYRLLWDLGS